MLPVQMKSKWYVWGLRSVNFCCFEKADLYFPATIIFLMWEIKKRKKLIIFKFRFTFYDRRVKNLTFYMMGEWVSFNVQHIFFKTDLHVSRMYLSMNSPLPVDSKVSKCRVLTKVIWKKINNFFGITWKWTLNWTPC